ncbi:MAG: glutamate 5-kinase [Candidatus Omnitrophota bacterium]|jgi:glutamate 5-kinase
MRERLKQCRKIVVKAGTSILTARDGKISGAHLERLAEDLAAVMAAGRQLVLVSSGAIAYGMEVNRLAKRPKNMGRLQACAAIGQGKLMHAYEQVFSRRGVTTAQVLLTRDALETRKRFLAARHTFAELFAMKALAIVNENDTVATEEIAFGDNDVLSVQVAHLIGADLLILLSDVDGFYLRDGSRLRQVTSRDQIEGELVKHLKDTRKEKNVGGMRAKLEAAKLAMRLGVSMMIVNGHEKGIVERAVSGEDTGTLFGALPERESARKKWIAYSAARKGALGIDDGACEALRGKHRSLLPGGIVTVHGEFDAGEVVELQTVSGEVFGRGVVRYASREVVRIAGKKTGEIESILGYKSQDEVIHRNDMILW